MKKPRQLSLLEKSDGEVDAPAEFYDQPVQEAPAEEEFELPTDSLQNTEEYERRAEEFRKKMANRK